MSFSSAESASIISIAFTVISSLATVGTLIIALKLYDQFGLKARILHKQADKVFELADVLKGKIIDTKALKKDIGSPK